MRMNSCHRQEDFAFVYKNVRERERERSNQAVTISNLFSTYFFYISVFGGLAMAPACRNFSDTEICLALANGFDGTKKNFLALANGFDSTKKNFLALANGFDSTKKNFLALANGFDGIKKNFSAPANRFDGLYICILSLFWQIIIRNINN